jgi:Recombinase
MTPQAPAERRRRGCPSSCPPEVLARVVHLHAEGWSLRAIVDLLNAENVRTPGGGQRWWPSHVWRLLGTRCARELLGDHDPAL